MNRFHYYRNRAILLFTLAVPLLFSTACNDFFGTADLKEEIQREVAVATADEVTAIVKADPSTGGNLSVIGEIKKKIGEEFSLTANPSGDYTFLQWTAAGGGDVTFTKPTSSTTNAAINNSAKNIEIIATFTKRPNIWPNGDYSPTGTDVLINQIIYAQFSKVMDSSTLNETTISVTSKPAGVQGATAESIWNNLNFTTNNTGFTLTPTTNMDSNSRITIIVSKEVKDIDGNNMAENFSWYFTTGDQEDTSKPEFVGDITIDKDKEFTDIPAVQLAGGAFAVDGDDILINLTGDSNSTAGVYVTAIEIAETDVLSGTTQTQWYGYQSLRPYTLKTAGDGEKKLDLRLQNSNGEISDSVETVYIYRDTVEPSIASFAVASNNPYTNITTPSISIGAITEEGTEVYRYAVSSLSTPPSEEDPAWSAEVPGSAELSSGDGKKDVYLYVKDTAGNFGTISDDIELDQTPPELSAILISTVDYTAPDDTKFTNQTSVDFTGGTATDSGAGGIEYAVNSSSTPPASGDAGWSDDLSSLRTGVDIQGSDGVKTIYLHARDSLDNTTVSTDCVSDSVTLDTTPPVINPDFTIDVSPKVQGSDSKWYTNTSSIRLVGGVATDATGIVEYSISPDQASLGWASHTEITEINYNLAVGENTFILSARDPLGWDSSLERRISLDTTGPVFETGDMTLTTDPDLTNSGFTSDTLWEFNGPSANDAGIGDVEYTVVLGSVSSPAPSAPSSGWVGSSTSISLDLSSSGLNEEDGIKYAFLYARDALGNTSLLSNTSSTSMTLDTEGPEFGSGSLSLSTDPVMTTSDNYYTRDTAWTVSGPEATDVGDVEYAVVLASNSTPAPASPSSGWMSNNTNIEIDLSATGLNESDGEKFIFFYAKDVLGNVTVFNATSTTSMTLDTTPPDIAADFSISTSPKVEGSDSKWYTNNTTIQLTGGEASDTYDNVVEYRVENSNSSYDSGWVSYTVITSADYTLSAGENSFVLYARDHVANTDSVTKSITLDTSGPEFIDPPDPDFSITTNADATYGSYTSDTSWVFEGPTASDSGIGGTVQYGVAIADSDSAPNSPNSSWGINNTGISLDLSSSDLNESDGTKYAFFYARDELGNVTTFSETTTMSMILDTTGPTIAKDTENTTATGDNNMDATDKTISTFSTTDSGSDVASYGIDPAGTDNEFDGTEMSKLPIPTDGGAANSYTITATDNVGNTTELCVEHSQPSTDTYEAAIVTCP